MRPLHPQVDVFTVAGFLIAAALRKGRIAGVEWPVPPIRAQSGSVVEPTSTSATGDLRGRKRAEFIPATPWPLGGPQDPNTTRNLTSTTDRAAGSGRKCAFLEIGAIPRGDGFITTGPGTTQPRVVLNTLEGRSSPFRIVARMERGDQGIQTDSPVWRHQRLLHGRQRHAERQCHPARQQQRCRRARNLRPQHQHDLREQRGQRGPRIRQHDPEQPGGRFRTLRWHDRHQLRNLGSGRFGHRRGGRREWLRGIRHFPRKNLQLQRLSAAA